jgi:hypothetical protein
VEIAIGEDDPGNRYLRLADPEGLLFSNVVLTEIFRQEL